LALLLLISAALSFLMQAVLKMPKGPVVQGPENWSGWIVLILSCFCTGYLEESFFRFYLFKRLSDGGIPAGRYVVISSVLFACCHAYEGWGGALNALLAGIVLALVFARSKSLHALAWAHAIYNVLFYVIR
jgi:membrane protease YdiL (CAAX protease family)